jgi:hypothetical protein
MPGFFDKPVLKGIKKTFFTYRMIGGDKALRLSPRFIPLIKGGLGWRLGGFEEFGENPPGAGSLGPLAFHDCVDDKTEKAAFGSQDYLHVV